MTVLKLQSRFLIQILIISILLMIFYTGCVIFNLKIVSSTFPLIIVLFTIVSTFCHLYLLKAVTVSFRKFNNTFLLTTTLKLLLFLLIMAAYIFINRAEAKLFIFNFTAIYFIYTPFEVIMILKQSKKIDKSKNG